ncbi:R2-like ligand-binding oxidase [Peribacillus frigoritolerans]|uniref:R2-like ligand-binding oxidase n=1 Tax=Peribacillus frigoritolerans TaxID=450367 RepID=UPI0021AB026C|nr:R2-like ligand-binding oxidase [Peribacillus frigoritolerans]MCT4477590.1 R2-like ligand-binding oxidase [Peribacillus frigoritolerans]
MRKKLLTTSSEGLMVDSYPYQLYQKAKKFGIWNPQDINLSQDQEDWKTLSVKEKDWVLKLLAQFQGGEEAVTLDLLPLLRVIAREGRLEEEMFLTTFLCDEAKHTEFFRLVLNAIGEKGDLSHLHSETYRKLFYEILPETMERLWHEQTPEVIADAATVYNMFAEGVLAETGYKSFYDVLKKMGKMPGLLEGIDHLKKDESRHIAYGTYLLQRLICEHPHLFDRVVKKLEELAPISISLNAEGVIGEGEKVKEYHSDIKKYSEKQLMARIEILARAKGQTIEEIYRSGGNSKLKKGSE